MTNEEIQALYDAARRTPIGSESRQEAIEKLKAQIEGHPQGMQIFAMCDALIFYPPHKK